MLENWAIEAGCWGEGENGKSGKRSQFTKQSGAVLSSSLWPVPGRESGMLTSPHTRERSISTHQEKMSLVRSITEPFIPSKQRPAGTQLKVPVSAEVVSSTALPAYRAVLAAPASHTQGGGREAPHSQPSCRGSRGDSRTRLGRGLLLLCPEVCGCWGKLRRWRYARQLRGVRLQCEKLRQQARRDSDQTAPCGHLQSAEQHLAAVERWLRCSGEEAEVDGLTALATGLGTVAGEDEDKFLLLFFPPLRGERLLAKALCSVLSSAFHYPGDLFMTSGRLCFYARVMGIEASFSVLWSNISCISLQASENGADKEDVDRLEQANFAGHGHALKVVLREEVLFNDQKSRAFKLRIFDPTSLGQLHKCATHFTGAGLFDGLHRANPLSSKGGTSPTSPSRNGSGAVTFLTAQDLEKQTTVYQLERRATIWNDWVAPFLPHDAQKKCTWVAIDERYTRHPWIPADMSNEAAAAKETPPITHADVLGGRRSCTWEPVVDWQPPQGCGKCATDAEGWEYAADFYVSEHLWFSAVSAFSYVRRRRWKPDFSQSEACEAEPAGELAQKGLAEAIGSAKELLRADIGEVPLKLLEATLLQDDWLAEGSLTARYFRVSGAHDIQVGPWAVGGAAALVSGRVRSLEWRTPLPPAPLCPKETRCTGTWHVAADDSRVILESVSMSLDVPYGDTFNVITCDTFSIDEKTGRTCMVRTCAIEWVKSTWMQSVLETNVALEVGKAGAHMRDAVKQYVAALKGLELGEPE